MSQGEGEGEEVRSEHQGSRKKWKEVRQDQAHIAGTNLPSGCSVSKTGGDSPKGKASIG